LAAKHALRWPKARVIGVDFSTASVRHTQALKRKYNLENLEVYQLSLERVNELGTSFDQIVCTGVLHHLADPVAGLKALREKLKPDGAMHLMVYAPYGRTGIYMLQEFCRRLNLPATDQAIRELITALSALPPGHPLENLLRQAPDFRQEAALADALLHPQDRAYSVPQLFDFIQEGGLTFGRWVKQAPYAPQCGVIANIPQATRLAKLSPVEQYAAVELFRGTMVRHSAVVYRDDTPSPQAIQFTGDAWLSYVPIRMADTICVEERVPQGATAVLINRTHTYTDIFLPINAAEKRLLDAIDGKRSLTEIMAKAETSSPKKSWGELARSFFERLWWYDQVLFDASIQNE